MLSIELPLLAQYEQVRLYTLQLCHSLETEDYTVQVVSFASPIKWHLAHATWFFEEFILVKIAGYRRFNSDYNFFFNSYYNVKGERVEQGGRGLSRPYLSEILAYREHVDEAIRTYFSQIEDSFTRLLTLGLHHEQQHQELILMDLKYLLGTNPLQPDYPLRTWSEHTRKRNQTWLDIARGTYAFGHPENDEFGFDNEYPRHERIQPAAQVAGSNVLNGEYQEFVEAGGYNDPKYWSSDGWQWTQTEQVFHPLYWSLENGRWYEYTFFGKQPLHPDRVVMHVSYHEARAYAKWKGLRLPTEFELEILHDRLDNGLVWEWTSSPYLEYPGYQEPDDETGEYNAKFMVNQYVLRGGCVATPPGHLRATYRNFYRPTDRWCFAGIRLAR